MKQMMITMMLAASVAAFAQENGDTAQVVTPEVPYIQPEDPWPEIDGDAITADLFKRLEDGVEAKLALMFDTVVYVNGDDAYIRAGCGQSILMRKTGLPFEVGQILYGSIIGQKSTEGYIPAFEGTEKTTTENYYVMDVFPYKGIEERKLAFERDMSGTGNTPNFDNYVSDLVVVDTVLITEVRHSEVLNCRARCSSMGDSELDLIDKYGNCSNNITVGQRYYNVTGILGLGESNYQLYVLNDFSQNVVNTIRPVNTSTAAPSALYDLQGRRLLEQPRKGVYIRDGRKVVVK